MIIGTPRNAYSSSEASATTEVNATLSTRFRSRQAMKRSSSWCVQTTPHRTHTRALFLDAHARTPDVIARLAQAQGLDASFVCLKSHFMIGHVFVECSFDPVSSYCLIDATYCLTDATDWNQSEPPVQLRSGVDRLAIWQIRSKTQVLSPSSASMSVASTRRSTFRPET